MHRSQKTKPPNDFFHRLKLSLKMNSTTTNPNWNILNYSKNVTFITYLR